MILLHGQQWSSDMYVSMPVFVLRLKYVPRFFYHVLIIYRFAVVCRADATITFAMARYHFSER